MKKNISGQLQSGCRPQQILMLLSNAFDPDPRVHREAKALVDAGYMVTLVCWDRERKSGSKEVVDDIQIERIFVDSTHDRGLSQILFLGLFWMKAFWRCLFLKYDVIHAHDFDTLPLGYFLALMKRARLVYDSHESYVDMVYSLPAFMRKSIVFTENFLMKRADLVVTVGEILRCYLQERGARNICVVGNWQNPEQFEFDQAILQHEKALLGICTDQKTIVFIANLGRERRIEELIEVVRTSPDTFLVLGGTGPCAEKAQRAADSYPNISFLGRVHPSRVPLYTALADIIFYGFDPDSPNARFSAPNKLFECLAAGKVVLTGDFGEIAKIVKEEECGIVLPSYSVANLKMALTELSKEKLRYFGENSARAGRSKYSWSMAKQTLLDSYCNLLPHNHMARVSKKPEHPDNISACDKQRL